MKKVLMVAYGGGHISMVLPVARLMLQEGRFQPLILGLTTAHASVIAAGFPCLGLRDFLTDADDSAIACGRELARDLDTAIVGEDESAAYLGLSWMDLLAEHGQPGAEKLYAEQGRQCFSPVATMTRVLKATGADLLLTTSAPRAEKAAVIAAARLGVPAVCMVDLFAAYEFVWLREPDYAQRICVMNGRVRDKLLAAGRPPEDIVVTGNPAFDSINETEVVAAGRALRSARGWGDASNPASPIVVTWISQVEPSEHSCRPGERGNPKLPQEIWNLLSLTCQQLKDVFCVCRAHPSEPADDRELPSGQWLSRSSEPLHALLHASDLVVVMTSTVGLEASIAGTRVLQVLGSLYSVDAPYLDYGVAERAVTLDTLAMALAEEVEVVRSKRRLLAINAAITSESARTQNSAAKAVVVCISSVLDGQK